MSLFLSGKIAVVTGGTRGIGRAIAEALLEAGASVAVCGRTPAGVESAVAALARKTNAAIIGQAADTRNVDEIRALFQLVDREFGGLDILVNNAGVGVFGSVAELSLEDWRQTLDTNLSGVFHCCREALPRLRNRGGGFIVNIGSLAGRNAFAGGAAYNASKFGLNGFSEAMMLDHRYDNVRVSSILPGSVETGFGGGRSGGSSGWKIAPEDIAEVVLAVLRMPARTLVSRVEVRPSKPAR